MTNQGHQKLFMLLDPLREYFRQEYQTRLDRLILFGSQARGEALPTSDIDILIVLQDPLIPAWSYAAPVISSPNFV
ncbi:MAG: nucleotidyltransferase domain-containing protein [Pseudanabaena sp. ELA607]